MPIPQDAKTLAQHLDASPDALPSQNHRLDDTYKIPPNKPAIKEIADYARCGLYSLQKMKQIQSSLILIREAAQLRYEAEVADALDFIIDAMLGTLPDVEDALHALEQRTRGWHIQGRLKSVTQPETGDEA